MISHAIGQQANEGEYRQKLIKIPQIKSHLPRFIKTCRTLGEFLDHIKEVSGTYQGRRDYLRDEFNDVLTMLEERVSSASPIDGEFSATISGNIDYDYVHTVWQKAFDRRTSDPEGAITIARTLLEATCKHIMYETNVEYNDKAELPQLYKGVQGVLNLAPNEHTEQIFKEILSECVSVVKGLGH
ncbi:abortive phage resistance protein [Bacillus toyonensis]|nr:abortive phage resistance protein [Bacillus toyonensis]PGC01179.1 abortive phage resistance protein [Bacillus toyonensis]